MEFLYLLEKIRIPGLNELMLAVTTLGEETAFLVIGLLIFWCFSKRGGYYIMGVGFLGTIANQFLKILCRVPRPWVLDENFSILEQARAEATGYSFPSGHTQSAVGTFGAIASITAKRWLKAVCIVLAALVALSRMYVGVHTPADVFTAIAMAVVFIAVLHPLMMGKKDRTFWVLLGLLVLSIGYLLFMELATFPADVDAYNLEHAQENAYTMLGCTLGLLVCYPVEKRYIRFEVKACWWAQILKFLGGLIVVLAVKEGLRTPLDLLFAGHMAARAARYFLIVMVAGLLWPLTFRFFSRLGMRRCKNG